MIAAHIGGPRLAPDRPLTGLELPIVAVLESSMGAAAATYSTGELPNQPPHFSASRWPTYKLVEKPEVGRVAPE